MHGLQHLGRKLVLTLHVNHCGPLASEGKRDAFWHLSVRRVMGAPTSTVSRYFSKRTQFRLGTGRHCVPTSLAAGGSHVVQLCQPWEKVIRTISTHILAGAAAHLHQSPFLLPVAEETQTTNTVRVSQLPSGKPGQEQSDREKGTWVPTCLRRAASPSPRGQLSRQTQLPCLDQCLGVSL